jgi:hypothetical protein
MSTPDAPGNTARGFPVVTVIVALAFVGVGIGYVSMGERPEQGAEVHQEVPARVTFGDLYYVFVETVEFAPKGLDGDPWDLDDSAPDIAYQIAWKGQTVFESTEIDDALVGRWSGMKLGLDQALSLLKRGKADPAQIIDAALMRAESDGRFMLSFEDADLTGADAAGEFTVPWQEVHVGANVLRGPQPGQGVITTTLRVVPSSGDLFKVVRSLSEEAR